MARLGEQGIRLSSMSPSFLHSNSTSHTGPFSAVAELIDNAADPGVSAQRIWIDQTQEAGHLCISFTDDGFGMTPSKLHKMLSFGFTDKGLGKASQQAIGIYGNGFKSGSMRLGRDALIFTKNGGCQTVGLLSQTYLENIKAQAVMVPIVPFNQQTNSLVVTEDSKASLAAILQHSIVSSEKQIHTHFDSIVSKKGTKILIWNIRRDKDGKAEIDFMADNSDFRLPGIHKKKEKKDTSLTAEDNVPLMHYSLKAYLHILYLKPMIEIILRGKKVSAEPLRLTHTEYDEYNPQFSKEKVKVTFGMNHSNMEQYGIMMYYKNRLIKAYERVGFQLKISGKRAGKGVIGIIECNFLKPAHNKQDFDYSKEYRLTLAALGHKLNDYWKNIVNEETKEQEKKDTLDIQRAANNEQPQSRKWEMSSQEHQKLKCPPSKLVLCLNRLESVAMADRVKPVEKTSIVDHAVEDHAEGHTNTNVRPVTVITHLEQRSAGRTTNEEFFPQQAEIQTCDQWNGFEKNRNDTNVQTIEKDKEHRFKPRCKRKYDSCFSVMSKRLNLVKYQHVSGNGDAFHQESQRNTFSSVQSSLPPTQAGMVMVPLSQSDGIQGDQLLSEEKDREAELLKLALLQREVHRLQTLLGMGGINQTEGTMTAADSSTGNHRDIIVTSSAKREMDFQTDGAESSPAATGPHSEPQPAAELAAGQGCVFPGPKEVPKTYGLQKNRRNADGSLKVCDCDAAENSRSVWENLVKVRTNVVTLLTALLPQLDLTGISLETLDVDNILQQIIEVNSL